MLKHTRCLVSLTLASFLLASGCGAAEKNEKEADTTSQRSEFPTPDKLTVYYFHTTQRCWTCNQFEKLTREVLTKDFAGKLSDGVLEFKAINIEKEPHKHFVRDYRLVTKSLILSLAGDGTEVEWKNLDKIWQLARDSEKFKEYVRGGIEEYLKKIG
jgi:hypothetical protein